MAIRNSILYAVLEWKEGKSDNTFEYRQLVLPYIKSFKTEKQLNNMEITGTLVLPKNVIYNLKRKRDEYESAPLTQGAQNGPLFFEPLATQQITKGLQILNAKNQWVDVKTEKNQSAPNVGPVTSVKEFLIQEGGFPIGQVYSYASNGNKLSNLLSLTTAFTSKKYNAEKCDIIKSVRNITNSNKSLFKVGDVITIRYGWRENYEFKRTLPKSYTGQAIGIEPDETERMNPSDDLLTERFYIKNISYDNEDIKLDLEGWTWKLRQIPVRLVLDEQPIIDLLKNYVIPIILQETFIEYIYTRDGCKDLAQSTQYNNKIDDAVKQTLTGVGGALTFPTQVPLRVSVNGVSLNDLGKFTDDLCSNKLGNIRIRITNMYDLMLTLYDKYLLSFTETDTLGCKTLSLSMGYGYRKNGNLYKTNTDIIEKQLSNIDYDAYKVLVRATSNKRLTESIREQAKAIVEKNPTSNIVEVKNNLLKETEYIYGDRALLGMIRNNADELGGFKLSRDSTVDRSDIVNLTGLQINQDFLKKVAKRTYVKMKYSKTLGSVLSKSFNDKVSLYDIIQIVDTKDIFNTGYYTVTSVIKTCSVNEGYSLEIGLGVRIPVDKLNDFTKLIET